MVTHPDQPEDIQTTLPSQTTTMPRGNRGQRKNDDGSDDDGHDQRNHYWSLRDIPKFEGKGEQPFSHLMEFEDYLVVSGMTIEPECNQIIETSSTSLKHHPRTMQEYGIVCTLRKECHTLNSAEGWNPSQVKSKFLTYFNPIGITKEKQNKSLEIIKMET